MDILIFDMDGVLLEAKGYHRALQKTVQLAGEHLSLDNIYLTRQQIFKFESIGISSEWHSSALCMAFLEIQFLSAVASPTLDLDLLFTAIENQPLELPAIERGIAAIEVLCKVHNIDPKGVVSTITESENINCSLTMKWFQELVLGSEVYQTRYNKPGRFNTTSYLEMYDIRLLSSTFAKKIKQGFADCSFGVAIMTNRPSCGPEGFSGSPEAELGMDLVQLSGLPLIGLGDIAWLAERVQGEPGKFIKPNSTHALAAILVSLGLDKETSLKQANIIPTQWPEAILKKLRGGKITVFEDTPAGILSLCNARKVLDKAEIDVEIRAIGIAREETKKNALESQGARVFPEINAALLSLDHFGERPGD